MFENEEAHLFVGRLPFRPRHIKLDPEEVCEVAWMDVATLQEQVRAHPERFTVWLGQNLQTHGDRLEKEAMKA